ncbi:MAG: flagellar protein FlgN [Steroidobacteraceae bacterium]
MPVSRAQLGEHIGRLLNEEHHLLGELEQLLSTESEVLRGDDADAIERVSGSRQRCVEALVRIDADRQDCCRLFSFGSDRDAFEKMLKSMEEGAALQKRWSLNLEIARRCKDFNDRNGAVVSVKLHAVRQRLAALRGVTPPPVYGKRVSRFTDMGSRSLGKA